MNPCDDDATKENSTHSFVVTFPTLPYAPLDLSDRVTVPGYTIEGMLGRGGMGVVYLARQSGLNRLVALKMIRSGEYAEVYEHQRFREEALAIARLQHPNFVQIYEVGEVNGVPYFSLEYCAGGSLAHKLNSTPMVPQEAAKLVACLARAMQSAHDRGVIHRDLKPANVLLTDDGTLKISDFGLSKKLDQAGTTASGAIVGTPSYMAPEQAAGLAKEAGRACDVYALGAILYECLTGRAPFKAASALETLLQVIADDPVAPRRLNGQVPRDVEIICLKCLQKEPDKRYDRALALAEDLGRFLRGEAIRARPIGALEQGRKWAQRNPLLATLLALLACGMACIVYFAVVAQQTAEALRVSEKNARDRTAEAESEARRARTARHAIQIDSALRAWEAHDHPRLKTILQGIPEEFRDNWETRHLRRLHERTARTLAGHQNAVSAVSFSPDGKSILSGSWDRTLRLWDAQSGQVLHALEGHDHDVLSASFSPNGRWVASGSEDKTVRLWDVATGHTQRTFTGHTGPVRGVCFSPDGKSLLSASADNTSILWDVTTGKRLWSLRGPASFGCCHFSPDGKTLACGSSDHTVKLWDAASGKEIRTLTGHREAVRCVWFRPDGKRLVSGDWQGKLIVWDVATGAVVQTPTGHTSPVRCCCYSPDGKQILSGGGSTQASLFLWDAESGQRLAHFQGHTEGVGSVAFRPDGQQFVSGSFDHTVKVWEANPSQAQWTVAARPDFLFSGCFSPDGQAVLGRVGPETLALWDVETGSAGPPFKGHSEYISSASFTPNGRQVVSSSWDGTVRVWDAQTRLAKPPLRGHRLAVHSAAVSPNGATILSGSGDGTMISWDVPTATPTRWQPGFDDDVWSVCFSPDGQHALSRVGKNSLILWDARTGKQAATYRATTNLANMMLFAFSPDGKTFAFSGAGQSLRLGDVATRRERHSLVGHTGAINAIAFSPDGRHVLSAGDDEKIKVWDVKTGKCLLEMTGHQGIVLSVAFSPDGKMVVSASGDKTAKVWDCQTGQDVLTLRGHGDTVYSACFSPDGRHILSASADGTLKLWAAPARGLGNGPQR